MVPVKQPVGKGGEVRGERGRKSKGREREEVMGEGGEILGGKESDVRGEGSEGIGRGNKERKGSDGRGRGSEGRGRLMERLNSHMLLTFHRLT